MQGFKALDVRFSESSSVSHYLYVKVHSVREKVPEKPPDKTLFVLGVPPYCNEDSIEKLFSTFGVVINVFLHKTPSAQIPPKDSSVFFPKVEKIKGFKTAYVVFEKEKHINNVFECDEILTFPKDLIVTGVQKWNKEYNSRFLNTKEMEAEIKSFMDEFDNQTNKMSQENKDLSQSQEDGWVTVTKRGRNPGFARKESVAKQLKKRREKQLRKKELTNFYTFQIKASKMKNLVSLRKKFEEDKRKIAALKEARRFKPF